MKNKVSYLDIHKVVLLIVEINGQCLFYRIQSTALENTQMVKISNEKKTTLYQYSKLSRKKYFFFEIKSHVCRTTREFNVLNRICNIILKWQKDITYLGVNRL